MSGCASVTSSEGGFESYLNQSVLLNVKNLSFIGCVFKCTLASPPFSAEIEAGMSDERRYPSTVVLSLVELLSAIADGGLPRYCPHLEHIELLDMNLNFKSIVPFLDCLRMRSSEEVPSVTECRISIRRCFWYAGDNEEVLQPLEAAVNLSYSRFRSTIDKFLTDDKRQQLK